MFGRATIRLGIGPHSSSVYIFLSAFCLSCSTPYCVNVSNQIGWRVVGSYIKSGSLWLFLLMVVSHLGLIGSQAMANIWLCMWTDTSHCMPAAWRGGANHSDIPVPKKLEVYGIIGVIEGLYTAVTEQRHFPGECRGLAGSSLVFTARRSYTSAVLGVVILSVRLSVRRSVCLSHACFVTNHAYAR